MPPAGCFLCQVLITQTHRQNHLQSPLNHVWENQLAAVHANQLRFGKLQSSQNDVWRPGFCTSTSHQDPPDKSGSDADHHSLCDYEQCLTLANRRASEADTNAAPASVFVLHNRAYRSLERQRIDCGGFNPSYS